MIVSAHHPALAGFAHHCESIAHVKLPIIRSLNLTKINVQRMGRFFDAATGEDRDLINTHQPYLNNPDNR